MIRNLRSGAKDTSAAAAKDRRHLTKARVITAEDVVHLREEREAIVAKKAAKSKKWLEAAAAKVAGSSGPKSTGKKATRVKKVPVIVSCDGEEEQEEEWESSSEFEGDKEEGTNNFVDTEGEQDSESTGSSGKKGKDVAKQPLVVTRSGRVVKVGHLRE